MDGNNLLIYSAGITGLNPDGNALLVVGNTYNNHNLPIALNIPNTSPSSSTSIQGTTVSQIARTSSSVCSSYYVGGTFSNFGGISVACLAKVASDSSVSAVNGLDASLCTESQSNSSSAIFKLLTAPSVILGN